jgi:hypothetical protein
MGTTFHTIGKASFVASPFDRERPLWRFIASWRRRSIRRRLAVARLVF